MNHSLIQSKSIWFKVFLILLGISMPLWLGADETGLTSMMDDLSRDPTGNTLMLTAFVLVMLNTVRALPHYLGSLLLGDELAKKLNKPWLTFIVPFFIIPLVYITINLYNPLNYDFGGPALLLLISIVLLHLLGKGRMRPILKSFVLAQLLFGFQWLDMVIFLTPLGFGGGPISSEVKEIAVNIGFGNTLSLYSLLLCGIFMINAVVLAVYLTVSEQKWRMRQDLNIARGEMVESRAGREALHLVHDLKTPLSLIEGLNSLIQMKAKDQDVQEYTEQISESIESTSNMVSEILYEEKKNWCTLSRLIEYVRANKLTDQSIDFQFELHADPNIKVYVNKIRMTRAIVNLIDNACDAVDGKLNAKVTIRSEFDESGIWLGVEDNGKGLSKKEQQKIWSAGYSTKAHPGVGLTFVKNVVEEHEATLKIDSELKKGTTFWIVLPKECVQL
ncbi:sensor histidine kinase [Pontibacillus marinus]|uniref:histidine kinase n=1 Tax=Pontibacillus marinus BH030004 = DSM 16465 TaxID=1385511 RepID=A0A0A5GHQ5_9BACI|nr:HAMP domain-containing sensor histidine kinase [Pontibacillus marinus]KGX90645.1 histidine kinase [Pontibacillus marinus BH030004 = DSM 16465]